MRLSDKESWLYEIEVMTKGTIHTPPKLVVLFVITTSLSNAIDMISEDHDVDMITKTVRSLNTERIIIDPKILEM